MTQETDVVVIGAGQGGLAVSRGLALAGREHVVLERDRVASAWRSRWDGFHLVLPNWTVTLPGLPYDGSDPDGFMARDDVVAHVERYRAAISAPVVEGVEVLRLAQDGGGGFRLDTSDGPLRAREVVLATGGYQTPYRPSPVTQLPASLPVLDVPDYRSPEQLPAGRVLVVGSGQSGCQIAEELVLAGRDVVLACGKAPWQPRRIGGRDTIGWVLGTRLMSMGLQDLPSPAARLGANPQASGVAGGHELHYRTLQALGVTLVGHLLGVAARHVVVADDLAQSVAFGDARYDDLRRLVAETAVKRGLPVPEMPDPEPFVANPPTRVPLAGLGAVIVATGYRPAYRGWVEIPEAFDDMGFPVQRDGTSTTVPGLHVIGVHFQRNRASATLMGVGEDAEVLVRSMTRTHQPA